MNQLHKNTTGLRIRENQLNFKFAFVLIGITLLCFRFPVNKKNF